MILPVEPLTINVSTQETVKSVSAPYGFSNATHMGLIESDLRFQWIRLYQLIEGLMIPRGSRFVVFCQTSQPKLLPIFVPFSTGLVTQKQARR